MGWGGGTGGGEAPAGAEFGGERGGEGCRERPPLNPRWGGVGSTYFLGLLWVALKPWVGDGMAAAIEGQQKGCGRVWDSLW